MNQGDKIIDYLKRNDSLTTFEAFTKLHITKLSTRIGELERFCGHEFEKTWLTKKNADGTTISYMQYRLIR